MRPILEPGRIVEWIADPQPAGELPRHIRRFGYAPSISDLYPGDLILTEPRVLVFEPISWLIQQYQSRHFLRQDSRWTHAMVHIEDGAIVEVTLEGGVSVGHIYKYLPTHNILVRRPTEMNTNQRLQVAINARFKIRKRNEGMAIIQFAKYLLFLCKRSYGSQYTTCSQLYVESLIAVSGSSMSSVLLNEYVTPAHLSSATELRDVKLNWIKLSQEEV